MHANCIQSPVRWKYKKTTTKHQPIQDSTVISRTISIKEIQGGLLSFRCPWRHWILDISSAPYSRYPLQKTTTNPKRIYGFNYEIMRLRSVWGDSWFGLRTSSHIFQRPFFNDISYYNNKLSYHNVAIFGQKLCVKWTRNVKLLRNLSSCLFDL